MRTRRWGGDRFLDADTRHLDIDADAKLDGDDPKTVGIAPQWTFGLSLG